MRAHGEWAIVMRREMAVRLSEKSFRIGFIATLVLIVLGIVALHFFTGRTETHTVAVTSPAAEQVAHSASTTLDESGAGGVGLVLETVGADGPVAAVDMVEAGEAGIALIDDGTTWRLVSRSEPDARVEQALTGALATEQAAESLAGAGVAMESLVSAVPDVEVLEPTDENEGVSFVLRLVFGFMFVSALTTFGLSIAQSVVQEKESRVVEILVSATTPLQLLLGKIGANFVLGVLQVVVLTGVTLVGLWWIDVVPDLGPVVTASGWFLVFFMFGFLAIACVWSALGSMAARPDDLSSSAVPMQAVLFAAYFAALVAPEPILRVLSHVPVFSSITMPTRLLAGEVPWWEVVVSLGAVSVFGLIAVYVGAGIYRRSLLRTNRRTTLREFLTANRGLA